MTKSIQIMGVLFPILFGPLVWAVHFLLVYGGHTLLCADAGGRVDGDLVRGLLAGLTVMLLVVLGIGFLRPALLPMPGPQDSGFRQSAARWLILLSGFGVLWVGLAVLMLPACQGLR